MKRWITFYFPTITFFIALKAFFYALCTLLCIPVARNSKNKLSHEVKKIYKENHEIFYYKSARSALYALLVSLDLPPNSEVLVTGYTCFVVPNSIIQARLKPIYVDITLDNYGLCPISAEASITDQTKIMIIQHTYGIPAHMNSLLAIAKRYNLYVIEDCAVSLGSYYEGKPTGSFGDAAIFSFELSKIITCCRGGMLLLNTNKWESREKHAKFYKNVPAMTRTSIASNLFQLSISSICYRPYLYNVGRYVIAIFFKLNIFKLSTTASEFERNIPDDYVAKLSNPQISLLISQWKKLENIKHSSQEASQIFFETLSKLPSVSFTYPVNKIKNNTLIRYPFQVVNRDAWVNYFSEKNVEIGVWFNTPLSSHAINHEIFSYQKEKCPTAERLCQQICNFPVHMRLTREDINLIVKYCCEIDKQVKCVHN